MERAKGESTSGLGAAGFWALARTPVWLLGSVLFGLAILAQLTALAFAPLIVVQPVGVIALVFASALTAVVTRRRPSSAEIVAILVAVASLAAFVGVAAAVSVQTTITDRELILILIILLVVLAVTFAVLALLRRRGIPPVAYVVLGGLFAGFVATLGKTVILRVQTALASQDFRIDDTNLLTIACLVGIAVAGALSIYFVQTAHTV
ncbi:MAG TPA: multidrug DMT transporter permease, partial [Microbacterium sp.]|nr:multidrug DMT transporter permease [Microbacterium sp.]